MGGLMTANILGRSAILILVLAAVGATSFIILNRDAATHEIERQALGRQTESLQLDIPNAPWESWFFESLAERTKAANISNLRAQQLPPDDFEVRFWYDHFEIISGVVIRRSGQKWSASWIYQTLDHQPSSATQLKLTRRSPAGKRCGNNLVTAGILTLPDGSQVSVRQKFCMLQLHR